MNESFIDFIKIFCKSGNGGNGCIHFSKKKRRNSLIGKPDGGNGGNGGNIIFQGNSNINTFLHLKYHRHWIADSGNSGGKNNTTGSNGKDLFIIVPIGTIIKDSNKKLITEITENYQKKIVFKGGKGGKGNSKLKFFKKNYFYGVKTIGYWIYLEMKILSDVGIIGFPNVGKSTLLSVLTNAKPKIGNYEFTNKIPYLGSLDIGFDSFLIADIPGIIKDASRGKGLGLQFLKHIEKNFLLILLLYSDNKNNIFNQYLILLDELGKFNSKLLEKKKIIAISKSDLINKYDKEKIILIFKKIKEKIIFISSIEKIGIKNLIKNILFFLKKKK